MSRMEGEAVDLSRLLEKLTRGFGESFALTGLVRCTPGGSGFKCTVHVGVELASATYEVALTGGQMQEVLEQLKTLFDAVLAREKFYATIKEIAESTQPSPPPGPLSGREGEVSGEVRPEERREPGSQAS